jgi:Rps23 Pro-64 3,4-dihydroxylase Tpa1-like proline 4-hydroxylase
MSTSRETSARRLRERFRDVIERSDVAESLRTRGWATVDAFLEAKDADELRGALDALASVENEDRDVTTTMTLGHDSDASGSRRKYLRPNRTHFTSADGSKRFLFGKPHIFECDMHDDATLSETQSDDKYSMLWSFFDATSDAMSLAFASAVPELRLAPAGPTSRTVKLQLNEGSGGCFPWHYDNPGAPSKRALTCILYLNPDWKLGDGGELRLQPFCGVAATVAPRHNRLAIFYSDRTLHRVMPSYADKRYAMTVWIDGDFVDPTTGQSTNASVLNLNANQALSDVGATAKMLSQTNAQRALSRAVYADEYEQSLVECMSTARGAEEMLEAHYEHCRAVKKNAALRSLVDAIREYRREIEATHAEVHV